MNAGMHECLNEKEIVGETKWVGKLNNSILKCLVFLNLTIYICLVKLNLNGKICL
jgi:hypothetical protein